MAYYRCPKTTNERRALGEAQAEGVKVRAARNHRNLPNAWDDISRPYTERSWKKYRRKQWRAKAL